MSVSMSRELLLFFCAVRAGAGLLLCYDGIRLLRKGIRHSSGWIAGVDFFYWLCCGLYVFIFLYQKNDGIIRSYLILGMAAGMFVYYFLCSHLVLKWGEKILVPIVKILGKLIKRLLFVTRRVNILLYGFWKKRMIRNRKYQKSIRKKRLNNIGKKQTNGK